MSTRAAPEPAATAPQPVARTRPARRRILVIGPVPPPYFGGSVVTETLLLSGLGERYELVHLDTSDRRGAENIGRLDFGNVRLALLHGARCVRLLARTRPDMVYLPVAQNTLGFLRDALFLAPAALRGTPIIVHFHCGTLDALLHDAPAWVRALARTLLGRVDRAIVLGSSLAAMVRGVLPGERVAVVPNGVRDPLVTRRAATGPVRVLFLGNLIPEKGYAELVRAVGALRSTGVDIEAVLAGAVTDEHVHRRVLADCAAHAPHVRFLGPADDAAKRAVLGSADLLALPSYYGNEAHPLVLLEAMAAGLPVVSTRHAAIPEIVVEGETGLLVQPRDVDALAGALRRLALDRELRDRMGRAGRRRYEAEFTAERWAGRMARVFDGVEARTR